MSVCITGIESDSPASRLDVLPGDVLLCVNGQEVHDVLDYRFYMTERKLALLLERPGIGRRKLTLRKGEYEDPGLLFETYLMDKQRFCKNKCVFCFIDQLPPGLRDSLYFKDDDSRMSFLFGNYITLTNLEEWDAQRIIKMRISPINVSVHTTNPELRVTMMANPHAGEALDYLPRFAQAGISLNAQLVLCPGLNDDTELSRSLRDLSELGESLQSVAVVPVGLTNYRTGLADLRLFTPGEAAAVVEEVERFGEMLLEKWGQRTCFAADEFYLMAGKELPPASFYEEFAQLENGVGLLPLLLDEFADALAGTLSYPLNRRITLATGHAAHRHIHRLSEDAMAKFPGLSVEVIAVDNDFFGHTITVAGLVTGTDLCRQLSGLDLGEELLFPAVMLRHERDLFLDGMPVQSLSDQLGVPVHPVENDGAELLSALLGETAAT